MKKLFSGLLLLAAASVSVQAWADGVKWHPGHYMLLYPVNQTAPGSRYYFDTIAVNDLKAAPYLQGVMKKYFWNRMEPSFGVYDFQEIKDDIAKLKTINKRLIITVQAESFISTDKYVPSYLLTDPIYDGGVYPINTGKGYNVAYYNVNVQNRMIALLKELGRQFDGVTNLEAINLEETSPSRNEVDWNKAYIKDYIQGMLNVAVAAKKAFPTTGIIQYINYPVSSLPLVVSTAQANGIGIGGPDVHEYNPYLNSGAYTYYPQMSGILPIGMQVDYSNYESYVANGVTYPKPTPASIHKFAMDKLKPNYMFWLRRDSINPDLNYWKNVMDYFNAYSWKSNPSGGMITTCPSAIGICDTSH